MKLKRLVRPELAISLAVHGLLLALFLVGTAGVRSVPPAESVAVELVPSDEAPPIPHVDGTPLESTSNGSEVSSNAKAGSASTAPRPKSDTPPVQEMKARSSSKNAGSPAAAAQEAPPPSDGEAPPSPSEALVAPAAPVVESQPQLDESPPQPDASEMFAMPLALPGGRIGGGLDAPSSDPAMLPHDDTAAFRVHLSSCSHVPDWVNKEDNAAVMLRISFKPDGTLASPPQLLRSTLTPGAVALTASAIEALQRCQPFTELPADKYSTWKTLDVVVTPLTLSGQ